MKQAMYKNKLGKYNPETDSIIISVKEACRILGEEMSDKLSDEDLNKHKGEIDYAIVYNVSRIKLKHIKTGDRTNDGRAIGNKKESNSDSDSHMVNLVESQWNDICLDIYRIKGIISVLYPTTAIP